MAKKTSDEGLVNPPVMSIDEGPVGCAGAALPAVLRDYRLFDPAAMAIYKENLCGEAIEMNDLTRIKVPAGGATSWAIPNIEGDEDMVKEIQGIIIHSRITRAYWRDEYSGARAKPDCSSEDGITGRGCPGGLCSLCPMAQWESSPRGDGTQACKKIQLLFICLPGNNLPSIIPVPPGSLKSVRSYFSGLANKDIRYSECVTSLRLAKVENRAGIAFSQVVPKLVEKVPPDLAAQIEAFVKENAMSFARASVSHGDMGGDE
jgi:hypothetical protein